MKAQRLISRANPGNARGQHGCGLAITYACFNKPATITRGTASISFDYDD
jgi:hypothetical protein